MSATPIMLRQIVYGKLVQYPGGPIVALNEFHHSGYSTGLPEELILACTPKQIGIGVSINDWIDYPWLKEQAGWAVRPRRLAGQEWMVAVRATAFSEAGASGPVSSRLFSQAHYLVVPLAEWRAETLPGVVDALRAEPMTEDCHDMAPIPVSAPDDLKLEDGWLERLEPVLKALLSGQSVGWQSRTMLPGFLNDVRICLAALPDALACRLPLGAGLGQGGDEFALCHALGVATALRFTPPRPDPVWAGGASPDLSPGERYLAWMGPMFAAAGTTGELHGLVQEQWSRYADPAAPHCVLDWREAARLLDQSVIEATTVRDILPLLKNPAASLDLPVIVEPKNQIFLLRHFLENFSAPQAQRFLVRTDGWSEAWRAVSSAGDFLAESVQAALGVAGSFAPDQLRFLQPHGLTPRWVQLIAGRVYADLPEVTDPAPWLALFAQGILPRLLGENALSGPWVGLILRTARSTAELYGGLEQLGPFNPVPALCRPGQAPDPFAAALLATETHRCGRAGEISRAIFPYLAQKSPLGALLYWGALPVEAQPPLDEWNPGFTRELLADITRRGSDCVQAMGADSWFIAHVLLNTGGVEKRTPGAAASAFSRIFGPLAPPICRIELAPGVGNVASAAHVENLLRCLRAMPTERGPFWASALVAIAAARILSLEDLVKVLDAWVEASDTRAVTAAPPLLSWHAFFTGRGPRPDRANSPAPTIAPRLVWERLFIARLQTGTAEPWILPAEHGEFDLYFWLLQCWQQPAGKTEKLDPTHLLAKPIKELAEGGAGETNERLWIQLLQQSGFHREKGWQILSRILAAKHGTTGSLFSGASPAKRELPLIESLSACATILLALSGMEVPPERLNRIVLLGPDEGLLPSEDDAEKKGVMRTCFRSDRAISPESPCPIRLSMREIFVLARIAGDLDCRNLLDSLHEFAQGKGRPETRDLLKPFRELFTEPKTYAQLRKICR